MTMEQHQKLLIELSMPIPDFIACLEKHLSGTWSRNLELEKAVRIGNVGNPQYCFALSNSGNEGPVYVWLAEKSPTLLYVSNVLPHQGQLSRTECNEFLRLFVEQAVKPAADESGALIDLSSDKIHLEDLLSQSAASKLRAFSRSANKSTGSAHPSDLERWQAFLIDAHRSGWEMTTYQLGRWLSEEEGWPEQSTTDLMLEYEFAHELLRAYDKTLGQNSDGDAASG